MRVRACVCVYILQEVPACGRLGGQMRRIVHVFAAGARWLKSRTDENEVRLRVYCEKAVQDIALRLSL